MKLLILADSNSPHTIKWINELLKDNISILLISLRNQTTDNYTDSTNLVIKSLEFEDDIFNKSDGEFSKSLYLKSLFKIKKIIKDFKPDILHAYYASSYGFLAALTGFKPLVISVWGADVYNFPRSSFLNRMVLTYNFKRADRILSTSNIMAKEIKKYTSKDVIVTPFGIDTEIFKPYKMPRPFEDDSIVIGTIKSLEKKYGIEILIRAYYAVKQKYPDLKTNLFIVGGGTQKEYLEGLIKKLGIDNETIMAGSIDYDQIADYHNMLDIYVAVSTEDSESFGVAVLEASACEVPVIVSNAGGLTEVVRNNVTGLIVNKNNVIETADALEKLIKSDVLRKQLGKNGRARVIEGYKLSDCVKIMLGVYKNVSS